MQQNDVYACFKSVVEANLASISDCRDFAKDVALSFDHCASYADSVDSKDLDDVYNYVISILKSKGMCSVDVFTRLLCVASRGLIDAEELCKYFKRRSQRVLIVLPLIFRFKNLNVYAKFRPHIIGEVEVPIYSLKRSSKRFSEILSEILGVNVDSETAKDIFGFNENYYLFEHQAQAVEELRKPGSRVVVVSTPNASGKTEIGILAAMDFVKRSRNVLILVVYPTKALARDQFDRWKERFRRLCEKVLNCGIQGENDYYLSTDKLHVILLDGDTVKKLSDVVKAVARRNEPLIVLTNPQFLLSILQEKGRWRKTFGSRCLQFIVLDEIHFYRARDLTLLIKILEPTIMNFYVCKSPNNESDYKILILSATMGDAKKFEEGIKNAWQINDVVTIKADLDTANVIGKKRIYIVKVDDDSIAEALIKEFLDEMFKKAKDPSDIDKTLIFTPNRNVADRLAREFQSIALRTFKVYEPIVDRHVGDMALWERERVERNFKEGITRILVTVKTLEVGIDIGDVSRVIHWGLPSSLNDMIQREGRAGRRPGEYESIIIVRTARDKDLAEKYLQLLTIVAKGGNVQGITKYIYTPMFNLDAAIIKRLDKYVKKELAHKPLRPDINVAYTKPLLIPEIISIPLPGAHKEIVVIISFYTQDKRMFKVIKIDGARLRSLREVRIEDVIFRYLPGSIRPITRVFIVKDIDPDKKEIEIVELKNEKDLYAVWGGNVDETRYCLDISSINKGVLFTVNDVEIEFEAYRKLGEILDWIVIHKIPNGTKLVRKYYDRKVVMLKDGRVEIVNVPKFRLCGYKALFADLKEKLSTRLITRGIYVPMKLSDVAPLLNRLKSELKEYTGSDVKGVTENVLETLKMVSYLIIQDYMHYATHLLLDIASEVSALRVDDLEHYIGVSIKSADKLQKFLTELILGKQIEAEDPFRIGLAIANEVDLVADIKWHEVYNRIKELKEELEKAKTDADLMSVIQEVVPRLYIPRCYYEPLIIEDLTSNTQSQGSLQKLREELDLILDLSLYILGKIIQRIQNRGKRGLN
jgi:superfamily II DNA/RNA helicase